MKPLRPVHAYPAPPGYPAVVQPAPSSRRRFLGALVGGAATTAALVLARSDAHGQRTGLHRVDLSLIRRHVFAPCDLVAEKVLVQTRDPKLVTFLRTAAEAAGVDRALGIELRRATCADVTDRQRLARLDGRLAQALRAHYQTRTRRSTDLPLATLVLGKRRPVQLLGDLSVPAQPVPRP
jgi:hypothetical protein